MRQLYCIIYLSHFANNQSFNHSAQDLDDDRRKYEDLSEQRRAELSRERRGTEEVEAEVLALQRKVDMILELEMNLREV